MSHATLLLHLSVACDMLFSFVRLDVLEITMYPGVCQDCLIENYSLLIDLETAGEGSLLYNRKFHDYGSVIIQDAFNIQRAVIIFNNTSAYGQTEAGPDPFRFG